MRVNASIVRSLAIEAQRVSGGVFHLCGEGVTNRRKSYALRPAEGREKSVVFAGKYSSREAAAFLLGALVSYGGPDAELSLRAQQVKAVLFPSGEGGTVRASVDSAFLLGRQLADERITAAMAA